MTIDFKYGTGFLTKSNPKEPDVDKVYDTYGHDWNITKDEYLERVKQQREREAKVTPRGETAPDFELELLSSTGERTGTHVRLSNLLGKTVALAFGSYT